MSYTLIHNINTLVTCDDADTVLSNADLLIADNIIKAVGHDLLNDPKLATVISDPSFTIFDATHMYCYPGLINTHHHLYQIFSRNIPEVQNMELFPWLKYLYEIWKRLDADAVHFSSLVGMGELMKYGCTTCFDHHYVFPAGSGDLIGAQFAAADELGIRMYASRGSMDLSQKDGGLPPDSVVQTIDEIMSDSTDVIDRYHDASYGSMHRVALAPCSPFSVTKDLLRETAVLAREKKVRLHTHLCETLDEEDYMLSREGVRPLEYMQQLGWLGDDVWFAHGIHFNDEELKLLASTGTGIAHCPASNMKLASGIARVPEMLKLGVPVGLAVDGSASNDGSSLMEEMRTSYLLHRLNSGRFNKKGNSDSAPDFHAALSGQDTLKLATTGSARILGRDDIGCLTPGKCADFFLVDSRRLELVGCSCDPVAVLATVGLRAPVDYTFVNGKITVAHGKLTRIDESSLSSEAKRTWSNFITL